MTFKYGTYLQMVYVSNSAFEGLSERGAFVVGTLKPSLQLVTTFVKNLQLCRSLMISNAA